jgi:hypothetical protein
VKGEPWAGRQSGAGPDLTGMGSHHPEAYFVESILNPDAVVVDGPGWVDPDGRSIMPSYPDLTVAEVADLVAYLVSLVDPSMVHSDAAGAPSTLPGPRPAAAGIFLVHLYDPRLARIPDLEAWLGGEMSHLLRTEGGAVSVETYVDRTGLRPSLVTVLGFRDEASLTQFVDGPLGARFAAGFTPLAGAHTRYVMRGPPVYRAPSLSLPGLP